jgi:hypothetical protein
MLQGRGALAGELLSGGIGFDLTLADQDDLIRLLEFTSPRSPHLCV